MSRRTATVATFFAAAIGFAVSWYFVSRTEAGTVFGAFEGPDGSRTPSGTALAAAYGFGVTLLGAALGATYRHLVALRAKGVERARPRNVVKAVWGSVDFLMALVGAPLVFALIWQSLGDTTLAGLTVIALQNGFACNAIAATVVPGKAPQLVGDASAPRSAE